MSENPQSFGSKPIPKVVYQEHLNKPPAEVIPRENQAKSQADKLPNPVGYGILIVPYSHPRTSKGGILLADSTLKTEELATTIGYVISMGPEAYKDEAKFPTGPWCKVGDYIMFGRYAGKRIVMRDEGGDDLPLRILLDDEIIAVVDNPEDYVGVN